MLTDVIRISRPHAEEPDPIDIFSASASLLFPDDTCNSHGDPGSTITYTSTTLGSIPLKIAFDPHGEDERHLFAHYLWNSGVWLAEAISGSSSVDLGLRDEERWRWSVKGHAVLEMGAGLALAGIVSSLAGAAKTTLTDYPSPALLSNINANISRIFHPTTSTNTTEANVGNGDGPSLESCTAAPTVQGHAWGDFSAPFAHTDAHTYTRVLAADCLWMPWQHENLARSMLHFLAYPASASDTPTTITDPRVLVTGGFHTGRPNVASFFRTAEREGLQVEERWEVDVDGGRREWVDEGREPGEDITNRKRWLVVAVLKRAERVVT